MYYHVKLVLKAEGKDRRKVVSEWDLTWAQLIERMAYPSVQSQPFFCGGFLVKPSRIEKIQFGETDERAEDSLKKAETWRIASGVLGVVHSDVFSVARDVTREALEEVSPDKLLNEGSGRSGSEAAIKMKSEHVFVVHGHDHKAVDQTEILLHRFGLKPVILRDAASEGRTVIEKFEEYSDVGAAIVLLTPDDFGGIDEAHIAPRARQNVIWEWGYLVCKLGRSNVICLYKDGVEIPSDLHGIVTIHVADDVREKADEIRRELKAAGYAIP